MHSYSWILERIPEMEWSGFVFSRFFLRFLLFPVLAPYKNHQNLISIQKPSMSPVISQCDRMELRRLANSLQDRMSFNLTWSSLWKLAKNKKPCYSLVSCWGLTWKSCWFFDWKNGGQLGMDKSHENRPRSASCVPINTFSTPKPQLHVQAQCRCSKTLATLACVNGAKQFQIQEWIIYFSVQAPIVGKGCIVRHCHRSRSKSSGTFRDMFAYFAVIYRGLPINVFFAWNSWSVRTPFAEPSISPSEQALCFVSHTSSHQIHL